MSFLLKMGNFQCYVSLPEGNSSSYVTHQLQLQEVSPEYSVPSSDLEGLLRQTRRDGFMFSDQIMGFLVSPKGKTGWWFQLCFMFTPIWGRFPFWLINIFLKGLKPPTSEEYIGDQNELWKKICLVFPTHFANLLLTIYLPFGFITCFSLRRKT